ncbi:hypothetical protein SAMN05216360_104155 [Methylobacterium phyllostachyos]|uniref:Uncharacterized protein n=1 Tax=Methylobacterium phyllostachyos TaxID=582672 RepID=A0A1G9WWP9_9HYPH|nr:hypothetical protein SAMN05216360_104155 [Methylobacterium phyllostachyos]
MANGLVRTDMPDGRFAVVAVLASGEVFRRVGLATMAEAEEAEGVLRAIMAACGARVVVTPSLLSDATAVSPAGRRTAPSGTRSPEGMNVLRRL